MDYVECELVANAGVLVRYNGLNLLVDGIHCEDGHPFCSVSPMDLHLMRTGTSPFSRLDYLLFTHEHPDHFTPALVGEQLNSRPLKGLFMPDYRFGSNKLEELYNYARKEGVKCHSLSLDAGFFDNYELGGEVELTVIGARHMGPQYRKVRNDCFLLSSGGINILFTGDADHEAQYYEKALSGIDLDAVFVNPIFYHNSDGFNIIQNVFRTRNVVVYHLPSKDSDPLNLWYTVERAMEKYTGCGIRTHIFQKSRQKMRIGANTLLDG